MRPTQKRSVVMLSGGKDSVATLLWARRTGLDPIAVYEDTRFEWEGHYAHLDELERLIQPIIRIQSDKPFLEWCRHKGTFPSRVRRISWRACLGMGRCRSWRSFLFSFFQHFSTKLLHGFFFPALFVTAWRADSDGVASANLDKTCGIVIAIDHLSALLAQDHAHDANTYSAK